MLNKRNITCGIAGLVLSSLAAASAFGQTGHPLPADRNAALVYQTVFYTGLPKDLTDKVDAVEYAEVKLDLPMDKQPEAFRVAAEEAKSRAGTVGQLLAASKMTRCDFELPFEKGINVLLPHLGLMRKSARLLRLDAHRLIIEGKADEAAERIAACYRMSNHLKGDELLISTLVAVAVAGVGNGEVEPLIKSGKLSAAARESILQAIDSMGNTDPYDFKGALRGERRITIGWLRDLYKGPEAGKHMVDALTKEWGLVPGSKPELVEISKMDEAALGRALDQLDGYHELIATQWDLPDAAARLEVIGSRIEKGDFGPVSMFLAPSISKACAASKKASAELAATVKALKDYVPPASPANPK